MGATGLERDLLRECTRRLTEGRLGACQSKVDAPPEGARGAVLGVLAGRLQDMEERRAARERERGKRGGKGKTGKGKGAKGKGKKGGRAAGGGEGTVTGLGEGVDLDAFDAAVRAAGPLSAEAWGASHGSAEAGGGVSGWVHGMAVEVGSDL